MTYHVRRTRNTAINTAIDEANAISPIFRLTVSPDCGGSSRRYDGATNADTNTTARTTGMTRRPIITRARAAGERNSILPDTILRDAFHFAERVRSAIARLTVHGFHPTVSIGVAALRPGTAESEDQLLGRADNAAYTAKRAGGNRTVADEGPSEPE